MSYLLFVRSSADLDRACREVSEFFAFQNQKMLPASHELHGVWIEPYALLSIPQILVPPAWGTSHHGFFIPESFGLAGVWQLARLCAPAEVTSDQNLPDRIIESLHGLAGGAAGLFAPVFTGGASRSEMREEWIRLRHCYPHGLADPLVQDPHSGALAPLSDLGV